MTSPELKQFIAVRCGELSQDELHKVLDVSDNPQIDHIILKNGIWNMWDKDGNNFQFRKRDW